MPSVLKNKYYMTICILFGCSVVSPEWGFCFINTWVFAANRIPTESRMAFHSEHLGLLNIQIPIAMVSPNFKFHMSHCIHCIHCHMGTDFLQKKDFFGGESTRKPTIPGRLKKN